MIIEGRMCFIHNCVECAPSFNCLGEFYTRNWQISKDLGIETRKRLKDDT